MYLFYMFVFANILGLTPFSIIKAQIWYRQKKRSYNLNKTPTR
nr:MAG TPA: hypothetical protein [Siphoviridae sp. ctUxW2]